MDWPDTNDLERSNVQQFTGPLVLNTNVCVNQTQGDPVMTKSANWWSLSYDLYGCNTSPT